MYVKTFDPQEEIANAAINIQTIVNILVRKGIILSPEEWEGARNEAVLQLKGKNEYVPTPTQT